MNRTPVHGLPIRRSLISPTVCNRALVERVQVARQWDEATIQASVRIAS